MREPPSPRLVWAASSTAWVGLLLVVSAACTTTTNIYETKDSGAGGGDGGPGGVCATYLACLKELADASGESAAYDQAVMLYGSSSGCGQSSAAMQACAQACQDAVTLLQESHTRCGALAGDAGSADAAKGDTGPGGRDGSSPDVQGETGPLCAAFGASCTSLPCCAGECNGSTCACPSGQTLCGSVCADLDTDPDNCGACGNVCDPGGEGLLCGPVSGVAESRCQGGPFSNPMDISCADLCAGFLSVGGGEALACVPGGTNLVLYNAPAVDNYYLSSCSEVPPVTYEGGTLALVECSCYEP